MASGAVHGVLDLRTYQLVAGAGAEFDRLFREEALPMLERFGIQVAGYGPSIEDADRYWLARSFDSLDDRKRQLDAFYGSEEWETRFDARVLGLIESYHVLVLERTAALPGELAPPAD